MSVDVLGFLGGPHEPLWRYMKVSTLLLLMEGKAFFPSVKSLQQKEPLEAFLHCDEPWLITKLNKVGGNKTGQLDEWLLKQGEEWEKLQSDPMYNSHLLARLYIRELIKRRAAWCWHRSDLESAAMWSIYANAGVAIGTSVECLQHALPASREFQIAEILYCDRRTSSETRFNPELHSDYLHRPHLIKAVEFAHEREVRIVTYCQKETPGVIVDCIDSPKMIQQIVISPLLPYEEAKAIEASLRKTLSDYPHVHIQRSTLLGSLLDSEDLMNALPLRLQPLCEERNLPTIFATL
jgi:hypothetical protein